MTDEELQEYCGQVFRPRRNTPELTEADMLEIAKQVHEDCDKAWEETKRMAAVLDARSEQRARIAVYGEAKPEPAAPKKPWLYYFAFCWLNGCSPYEDYTHCGRCGRQL